MDLSKCHCQAPGICSVFRRRMSSDAWNWCQRADTEDRESYYKLTSKATPSFEITIEEEYKKLGYDPAYLYLYILTYEKSFHSCNKSKPLQDEKFRRTVELLEKYKTPKAFNNIEILCLGHNPKQFEKFPKNIYLKPVNLNELDAGKYSDNKWAETRAFIPENLFSSHAEYQGTVTVSWNTKYEPLTIDSFHSWSTSTMLLNSAPQDGVVLCADMFCPCCWTKGENSILSNFFTEDANEIGIKLLRIFGLELQQHVRVPFGNQIIAHRSVFDNYRKFLKDNNVLGMVDEFTESIKASLHKEGEIANYYHNNRIPAYFMEMISCFWFAKQNLLYIPSVRRKTNWYHPDNVKERMRKWDMISS